MDATAHFDLGERHYDISSSMALQLITIRTIIHAYFDSHWVREKLGVARNIIDVGACIGLVSLACEETWPEAQILAMEPHPESFAYLVKNCKNFPSIYPVQLAASDKIENIRLAVPAREQRKDVRNDALMNIGMASRYGKSDYYAARASAVPLDQLVTGPVDFIKIDVEGAELTVLKGAVDTIQKHCPLINIELREDNLAMAGTSPKEVILFLAGLGYEHGGNIFGDPLFRHQKRRHL